jgi:hypothetical protein
LYSRCYEVAVIVHKNGYRSSVLSLSLQNILIYLLLVNGLMQIYLTFLKKTSLGGEGRKFKLLIYLIFKGLREMARCTRPGLIPLGTYRKSR